MGSSATSPRNARGHRVCKTDNNHMAFGSCTVVCRNFVILLRAVPRVEAELHFIACVGSGQYLLMSDVFDPHAIVTVAETSGGSKLHLGIGPICMFICTWHLSDLSELAMGSRKCSRTKMEMQSRDASMLEFLAPQQIQQQQDLQRGTCQWVHRSFGGVSSDSNRGQLTVRRH